MKSCLPITYCSVTQSFEISHRTRRYHCRVLCKISKRLSDWATDEEIMDERDFARFEFKMRFGGISCILTDLRPPQIQNISWAPGDESQWNVNQNMKFFIQHTTCEHFDCNMEAILSWLQCVIQSRAHVFPLCTQPRVPLVLISNKYVWSALPAMRTFFLKVFLDSSIFMSWFVWQIVLF